MNYLYLFTFSFLLISCENSQSSANSNRAPKTGDWVTKREDGTLKTVVSYANGVRHGKALQYYEDGKTLFLETSYKEGKRNGVAKKYYENGKVYTETNYENDKLNGARKSYYKSGKLKSSATYKDSMPGVGLEEYFKSGKQKSLAKITYDKQGRYLFLNLTEDCKEPRFYIGKLTDGIYFDKADEMIIVPKTPQSFVIDLEVYTPSFLGLQEVICHCKTTQGNHLVLKEKINL